VTGFAGPGAVRHWKSYRICDCDGEERAGPVFYLPELKDIAIVKRAVIPAFEVSDRGINPDGLDEITRAVCDRFTYAA